MNCNICFETKQSNDMKTLDCKHSFCILCLDKWRSRSNTCPNCRAPFVKNDLSKWPLITVYNRDFRKSLNNLFQVITILDLWNFIRETPPDPDTGYMFSNREEIDLIGNHELIQNDGHSGATFAYGMRIMQRIANDGWDEFVRHYS